MNKISEEAAIALKDGREFNKSNIQVVDGNMYVDRNTIARMHDSFLYVSISNWSTRTTRARINAIFHIFGLPHNVLQRDGTQYLQTHESGFFMKEKIIHSFTFMKFHV